MTGAPSSETADASSPDDASPSADDDTYDDVEPTRLLSLSYDPVFRLPAPRYGEEELIADAGLRIGLHVKLAEQAMMSVKVEVLRPFDPMVVQYGTTFSLYYVPGQPPSQLARAVVIIPRTMDAAFDEPASKDLVTRRPPELHREVLVMVLTPKGEKLLIEADAAARAVKKYIGQTLDADERTQLRELLKHIGMAPEEPGSPVDAANESTSRGSAA